MFKPLIVSRFTHSFVNSLRRAAAALSAAAACVR